MRLDENQVSGGVGMSKNSSYFEANSFQLCVIRPCGHAVRMYSTGNGATQSVVAVLRNLVRVDVSGVSGGRRRLESWQIDRHTVVGF